MDVKTNWYIIRALTDDSAKTMEAFIDVDAFFVEFTINSNSCQALGACQVNEDDLAYVKRLRLTLSNPFNVDCKNQVRAT